MCGIIAYTGKRQAAAILMDGLRRLAYRGYDSAGVAVQNRGKLKIQRAAGKLENLAAHDPESIKGNCGMGHTRWATHGEATEANAHPHLSGDQRIAIIHNGIIENADQLRAGLEGVGIEMQSETDSEVLAHLIRRELDTDNDLLEAVCRALKIIQGTYGLVVIDAEQPGTLIAARAGSPVVIGIGDQEMLVASDTSALAHHTREVCHLLDGDVALITAKGMQVRSLDTGARVPTTMQLDDAIAETGHGDFPNYMLKEIFEQPESLARTLGGRLDKRFNTARLGGLNINARELLDVRAVKILGCGTAYYAGLSGAHMIENLARIPASAEPAAEFRYRNPVIERDTLYIVVSQSGETFDTLAATREIQRKGGQVIGINNVVGSSLAREVDGGIYMHAGPEISVASTKAYTSMVASFALLALYLGRIHDLSPQAGGQLVTALEALPAQIEEILQQSAAIAEVAAHYQNARSAFYIGRADAHPIAMEGALKLKEIAYLHAEAYPTSELKHGPLALIDPDMPTVVALPNDELLDKSISSLAEIKARQGKVIVITNARDARVEKLATHCIVVPDTHNILHPILMAVAMQLFAYHIATALGRDVDQPRNLAKSVTVE